MYKIKNKKGNGSYPETGFKTIYNSNLQVLDKHETAGLNDSNDDRVDEVVSTSNLVGSLDTRQYKAFYRIKDI